MPHLFRLHLALFLFITFILPFNAHTQDLNQLKQFRDQSGSNPSSGDSRSSLLKNYYSSFTQDQNLLDKVGLPLSSAPSSLQSVPLESAIDPEKYVMGAGDLIEISVFGIVPINLKTTVAADGNLVVPNIGAINVDGKTFATVKAELISRMDKQYKSGAVSITLQRPRTFLISVTGAVRSPGQQVISSVDRVDKAVILANSLRADVNEVSPNIYNEERNIEKLSIRLYPNQPEPMQPALRQIQLRRKNGEIVICDLIRYYLTGDQTYNPTLKEGDLIIVPNLIVASIEKVGIYGAVQIPALYEYSSNDSLTTLIKLACGTSSNADLENVQLVRRTPNGKFETKRVNLKEIYEKREKDIPLFPNDRIQIPVKNIEKIGNITIKGAVKYSGYYAIEEGKTTLKEIIQLAGGFSPNALLNAAKLYRKPNSDDISSKDPIGVIDPGFERARILRGSNLNPEESATFDIDYNARRNTVSVNFTEIFSNKEKDVLLQNGDLILIPKDEGTVYLFGQVSRPGFIKHIKGWRVQDYINAAGGETSESTGDLKILKAGGDEWKTPSDTEIESGDWIIAPKKVRKTFAQNVAEYSPIIALFSTFITLGVLIYQVTSSN